MKRRHFLRTLALPAALALAACAGDDDGRQAPPVTLAPPPTEYPSVAPPSPAARPASGGTAGATTGTATVGTPGGTGTSGTASVPRPTMPVPRAMQAMQANPNAATATLTEVGTSDAKSLNPILIGDPVSDAISRMFFSGLVAIDPRTGNPTPDLAESFTVSDDGLAYTFTLRNGVKWSDGQAMVPEDIVFTYNLYQNRDANSPHYTTIFAAVEGVTTITNRAVRFRLRGAAANFLTDIATFPIVPQHSLVNTAPADLTTSDFGTTANIVGTGPFRVTRWLRGERIEAEANPTYHLGKVAAARYVRLVLPTDDAVRDALATGAADFGTVSGVVQRGLMGRPGLKVLPYDTYTLTYVGLQLDAARQDARPATRFLTNRDVRRALMLALDREMMLRDARGGLGFVADGIEPPPSWATTAVDPRYRPDPEGAKRLLDAAGWLPGPDGVRVRERQPLTLTLLTNNSDPAREAYARLLREAWTRIGVGVAVQVEPWSAFRDRVTRTRDFDAFIAGITGDADPHGLESSLFSTDAARGGLNLGRYLNTEMDGWLTRARSLYKPEQRNERRELYVRVQQKAMAELPILPLDFARAFVAVSDRVTNFGPSAGDLGLRYRPLAWQWGVNDSARMP